MAQVSNNSNGCSTILQFYRGRATDNRGRTITEVQQFDRAALEGVHDYIQWLFPLDEPSGANPQAPILTDDDIATFRLDDSLRSALLRSLEIMLNFYGLGFAGPQDRPRIELETAFAACSREWISPGNHNYLRLTRILKSLRLLGCEQAARALFDCLVRIYRANRSSISATTFAYWQNAVS